MSGQNLDYVIMNKEKYLPSEGKIDCIYQKNSPGFLVDKVPKCFSFEIKLRHKSVVKLIEVKPDLGRKIIFQLIGEKNIVLETIVYDIKQILQPVLLVCQESTHRKLQTTKIKVEIYHGSQEPETVGLNYLLIKGDKVKQEKGPKNISKRPQKEQFFDDAGYSPHKNPVATRVRDKAIFSDRNKVKTSEKRLTREEEELQRALELSKKEMEIQQKPGKMKPGMRQTKEDIKEESNYYMNPRQYTKLDYEKYKKVFQYVNSSWVQAQRRIEIEKGVRESERLSNAIQVRHFHNKIFCIDVAPQSKKQQLVKMCEDMGGKVNKEVSEHCLLITSKLDTERVSKAKKMKSVKILNPEFIVDCKKTGAYLDEKMYLFRY